MAGRLCTTRKRATAASTARMSDPATTVLVEKTRSPRRILAFGFRTPAVPAVIPSFLSSGMGAVVVLMRRSAAGARASRAERLVYYLMVAAALLTLAARSFDSGAEPACS